MRKNSLLIIVSMIFAFMLYCYQAYAGRPFSTEDATVANKGTVEGEIGFEYTRQNNRDDNYNITVVPIYGLTENIEVSGELPFEIIRPEGGTDEEGLNDISLVVKTLLSLEKEKIPSFVLKTTVKLSNGNEDKGLGSGDEDAGFVFAATKSFDPFTVHGNIGYTFVGDDKDITLNDILLYGLALEYTLSDAVALACEIYGEGDSDFKNNSHTISPLIGLTYQITEKITFDTAFKVNMRDGQKTEYCAIGGISVSF